MDDLQEEAPGVLIVPEGVAAELELLSYTDQGDGSYLVGLTPDQRKRLSSGTREQLKSTLMLIGGYLTKEGFVFPSSLSWGDRMELACTSRGVEDTYRYWQQFATPPKLALRMVKMADAKQGDVIVEPSAGRGAIVQAILERGHKALAIEIEPTAQAVLAYKYKVEHEAKRVYLYNGDFLTFCSEYPDLRFPAVVAHPPHMRKLDIEHTLMAYRLLKPGGTLVTVLSEFSCFDKEVASQDFKAWLAEVGAEYETLPNDTFQGGFVKGVLTWITKPANPEIS